MSDMAESRRAEKTYSAFIAAVRSASASTRAQGAPDCSRRIASLTPAALATGPDTATFTTAIPMDYDAEIHFYRMIQEAVRNISRHARASKATAAAAA